MEPVSIIVIAVLFVAVVFLANRKPVFDADKFETIYDTAVSKHGEDLGHVIATSAVLTADALGAKNIVNEQLTERIETAYDDANDAEESAAEIVAAAEQALKNAKAKAAELNTEAGESKKRAAKLEKLASL